MSKQAKSAAKPKKKEWLIKCPGCGENVTKDDAQQGEAAYLLGRIWHLKHLSCKICKASITISGCRPSPMDGAPMCIDCYMEMVHPCCDECQLPLRETCVTASRKKFHHECFRCYRCRGAMPNGEYYMLNGNAFDEDCYFIMKCVRRSSGSRQ